MEDMEDLQKVGTVHFWIKDDDPDWVSNLKKYAFPVVSAPGISVVVAKHESNKLDIRISGPFAKSYFFDVNAPQPEARGIFVLLAWGEGEVSLHLNAQLVQSKGEHAPLIESCEPAFSQIGDAASRTVELAISFDYATNCLVVSAINAPPTKRPSSLFVPIIVCDSFAIELYLKALHLSDFNVSARGHNLETLFSGLSAATQKRIRDIYDIWLSNQSAFKNPHSMALDDVLKSSALAFEQWRYMNEDKWLNVDHKYLAVGFKTAVRDATREKFPTLFTPENSPPPTSPPP